MVTYYSVYIITPSGAKLLDTAVIAPSGSNLLDILVIATTGVDDE